MGRSPPKALLLDLDDTILDNSGNVTSAWQRACAAHAAELGAVGPVSTFEAIDRVREWFWSDPERHRVGRLDLDGARRQIVERALADLVVDRPGLAARIADTYSEAREAEIQPLAGAIDTLGWLRSQGCRLALLTNGGAVAQRRKIDRFSLATFFEQVLIEGELGFGKPDPRVYELALVRMAVAPSDTWMVGDNLEWDVAEPQRQGMCGVWVDKIGQGLPATSGIRPDRVVRGLSDLRDEWPTTS